MEDTPKVCVTCEWWALEGQRCIRKAPTRDLDQRAVWPITGPLMRCGDWEKCEDKNELLKRKITLQGDNNG